MTTNVLTNLDLVDQNIDGFGVYQKSLGRVWTVESGEGSILKLKLSANLPGLVMSRDSSPLDFRTYTKKEFQSVHNNSSSPELRSHILTDFHTGLEEFKNSYRTVGCGTNVYLGLEDGIFQVVVQRTAPQKTPEGVVNPGAYSRAAGGALGCLIETQIRELTEELNMFVTTPDGKLISVDLLRSDNPIGDEHMQGLLAAKYDGHRINQLYNQISSGESTPFIERKAYLAHPVVVPNLHELVEQDVFGVIRNKFHAVVTDDPANGDLGGVDSVVFVPMQNIYSHQIRISDGETAQNGSFLNRVWSLHRPEHLEQARRDKSMKFSPAPGKVIDHTSSVIEAFSTLSLK